MKKYIILIILVLAACSASEKGGYLAIDNNVNRFFLTHDVYPNHQYYYSGPDYRPIAIIAIHNDYTLSSTLWKSVDATPEIVKTWLNNMTNNSPFTPSIWGKKIIGPNGSYIGVWFSPFDYASINRSGDIVRVTTPNQNELRHRPRRAFGDIVPDIEGPGGS